MNDTKALVPMNASLALAGPLGSFDAYVDQVNRISVLTREAELELAHRFRNDNDLGAARELVISHLRFVVHIARGYSGYGLPVSDLVQEGNVGLMKAVKRFDPNVGVRLVSFAVHWIRAEIHEYVLRNWRLVRVATTKAQRKLFFNLRRMKRSLGWLSAAEREAVAKDLGVTSAEVGEMEQRLAGQEQSFDPSPASDEEESFGPAAYLAAPNADPGEQLADAEAEEGASESLSVAIERLDERSRSIIRRRWLAETKATLQELAAEYGVSAERIRQIEASAFAKLRGLLPAPAV